MGMEEKIEKEVERRVNMRDLAREIHEIHDKVIGNKETGEVGLCERVTMLERSWSVIKGVGIGLGSLTGIIALFNYFGKHTK